MVEEVVGGQTGGNISDSGSSEGKKGTKKEIMKTLDLILCEVIEQRQQISDLQSQVKQLTQADIVSTTGDLIGQIRPSCQTLAKPNMKDTFTFSIDGPEEDEEDEYEDEAEESEYEEVKFEENDSDSL